MQSAPPDLDRRIVPRWRSLSRTPVGELENHGTSTVAGQWVFGEMRDRIDEWNHDRSDFAARELLWASVVGGTKLLADALRDISLAEQVDPRVRKDARAQLAADIDGSNLSLIFEASETKAIIFEQLRTAKAQLRSYPRNPIIYIDCALMYCRLGQVEHAEKMIRKACSLGSRSRYILRAASRFFVHISEAREALQLIERSGRSDDPWVQATRIALYDLLDINPPAMRQARELLTSGLRPQHIAELAGAIATLEFKNGNIKKSKTLFKIGAAEPTDNMVAQLQWASANKVFSFSDRLLERPLTFEANAAVAKSRGDWAAATRSCADWLLDEPLSLRPAEEGSYLAAAHLHDYRRSIEFCEAGLLANPNSVGLLNNAAFSHAMLGEIDIAKKLIAEAKVRCETPHDDVFINATRGLIACKTQQIDEGLHLYSNAIRIASELKSPSLALSAVIHLLAEMLPLGASLSSEEKNLIRDLIQRCQDREVQHLFDLRLAPLLHLDSEDRQTIIPIGPVIEKLQ